MIKITGKNLRLERIINKKSNKLVIIPMDDGLLDGPEGGLRHMRKKVTQVAKGGADAILGFKGVVKQCYDLFKGMGVIVNLTASTALSKHTGKVLIGSVEEALKLGADGVAVHANISSKYEPEMLKNLGYVSEKCNEWGMPLLALMYPRREGANGKDDNYLELKKENPEEYAKLVRHSARIGVELGADIIKTQYTGSIETFKTVVDACGNVPVIMAGGPKVSNKEIFKNIDEAMQAGAKGVCIGRNSFNRENTEEFIKAIMEIVHYSKDVDYAMEII